jgi:hypothetical protein
VEPLERSVPVAQLNPADSKLIADPPVPPVGVPASVDPALPEIDGPLPATAPSDGALSSVPQPASAIAAASRRATLAVRSPFTRNPSAAWIGLRAGAASVRHGPDARQRG